MEGIIFTNIVSNADQLSSNVPWGNGGQQKQVESRISFNDGGTWQFLAPPAKDLDGKSFACAVTTVPNDKCALHLHSVTTQNNVGYVFSASGAPGILMGVGNVGDYLMDYQECDTFISTDGGISWRITMHGAYKYEIGDMGGLIVMVADQKPTDTVKYSYDHGVTWADFVLGSSIRAKTLTTDPHSTTSCFLLVGSEESSLSVHSFTVDFSNFFSDQCDWNAGNPGSSADFELWKARSINHDLECLLGHSQEFYRRKDSARCHVGKDFAQLKPVERNCKCERENFECDINYVAETPGSEKCILAGADVPPKSACLTSGAKYMGSSGYRKIPQDTCAGGLELDKPVEKTCSSSNVPSTGNSLGSITKSVTSFSYHIVSHYWLANSTSLLLRDGRGALWLSDDEGARFTLVSLPGKGNTGEGYQVLAVRMHDHVASRVFHILIF